MSNLCLIGQNLRMVRKIERIFINMKPEESLYPGADQIRRPVFDPLASLIVTRTTLMNARLKGLCVVLFQMSSPMLPD